MESQSQSLLVKKDLHQEVYQLDQRNKVHLHCPHLPVGEEPCEIKQVSIVLVQLVQKHHTMVHHLHQNHPW